MLPITRIKLRLHDDGDGGLDRSPLPGCRCRSTPSRSWSRPTCEPGRGHAATTRTSTSAGDGRDLARRLDRRRRPRARSSSCSAAAVTHREKLIAQKTLAMLADVAEHYPGKTIEYVSRVSRRPRTSRRRRRTATGARSTSGSAACSSARSATTCGRRYTDVGVGWYPSEQFVHIDTRPGLHDTAWTFLNGVNHYHPYWAELARDAGAADPSSSASAGVLIAAARVVGRFAPSTTGEAHPGTLLVGAAGVARRARARRAGAAAARGPRPRRACSAEWAVEHARARSRGSASTGTSVVVQSARGAAHEAALDRLAARGPAVPVRVHRARRGAAAGAHPTAAGRTTTRAAARRCRRAAGARCDEPLRARLDDDRVELVDEGGLDLSQTPARDMGDPIVRRRDGAIAYQLAVVVDDADAGDHRRRARPRHRAVHRDAGLAAAPARRWRRRAIATTSCCSSRRRDASSRSCTARSRGATLRARYRGDELCGELARIAGLGDGAPTTPRALLESFAWARVRRDDVVVRWRDGLVVGG